MKRMFLFLAFLFFSLGVFAQNSAGGFTYIGGDNIMSASVSIVEFEGLTVTRFNFVPNIPPDTINNPAAQWDITLSSSAGVSKILLEGTSPVGSRIVKVAVAINGGQAVGTQRISTDPGSTLGTFEFTMNPAGVTVNSINLFVAYEPSQQNPNATENTFLLRSITFQDAGGNNSIVYVSPGVAIPTTPTLGLPEEGATITLPYNFTWGIADAVSYTFQIDTDQDFMDSLSVDRTVTETSYTVLSLAPGTYYWRVRANGTGGNSDFSNPRSVIIESGVQVPSAPTLMFPENGATNQPTSLTLDWNDVTNAISYRVQLMLMNGTIVADQTVTTSQYAVSGLQNNTQYQWRVNATNAAGTSDWSETRTFTTESGVQVPSAPTLMFPENGATNQPTSLTLDWNDVTNAISYRVQLMLMNGTIVADQTVTGSQYGVLELQNGTQYQWRVNASNSAGTSDWSETRTFTTENGVQVPSAPFLLSPLNNSTGVSFESLNLLWIKGSNSPECEFQVDKNSSFLAPVFSGIVSGFGTTIRNLEPGTTYYWRVRGKNGTVYGPWSPTWNFMTEGMTSVEDNSIPTEFKIEQNYPNPFNPTTNIKYQVPSIQYVKIQIFDILGREVQTLVQEEKFPGEYTVTFDGSNLPSGTYFYRLTTKDFVETKKMILLK